MKTLTIKESALRMAQRLYYDSNGRETYEDLPPLRYCCRAGSSVVDLLPIPPGETAVEFRGSVWARVHDEIQTQTQNTN